MEKHQVKRRGYSEGIPVPCGSPGKQPNQEGEIGVHGAQAWPVSWWAHMGAEAEKGTLLGRDPQLLLAGVLPKKVERQITSVQLETRLRTTVLRAVPLQETHSPRYCITLTSGNKVPHCTGEHTNKQANIA
ncbi:hypothetical protein SKAU_G00030910 [Synaphobranchus kaupii]|uniref:Uncharacterized protein n=1 Tax=Synaphobranchus kaupii TaxID=118154 RepID=A0A9Q1GEP9_SYNKA|nr:hypothetical protein SKAU_G00030910 [Synaphobranchus kaupii]